MKVGDALELVGILALTVAAYLIFGIPGAILVGGAGLVYEGQCWAGHEMPHSGRKRELIEARAQYELALATPSFFPTELQRMRERVLWLESQKKPLPGRLEIPALTRWRQAKQS